MASELRVNTLKDAAGNNSIATSFVANGSAKASINFTQVSTQTIRSSVNISSLTDAGTGQTSSITFTSSMADSLFFGSFYTNATTGTDRNNFNNDYTGGFGDKVASSFGTYSYGDSGAVDSAINDVNIHGDLA